MDNIVEELPTADDEAHPLPPKRMRRDSSMMLSPTRLLAISLKSMALKFVGINELAAIKHCLWIIQEQVKPFSELALNESAPESLSLNEEVKLVPITTVDRSILLSAWTGKGPMPCSQISLCSPTVFKANTTSLASAPWTTT
jgi:hypothetical protein